MTLQTFIEKVCARLKNPDCDSPYVTDTSTYAGRIMELFKLELGKITAEISQEKIFEIYGLVNEKNVSITGELNLKDIDGDHASRVIFIAPTPEDTSNAHKYFLDKTSFIRNNASFKDWIPDSEVWYNEHNNVLTFWDSSGSSVSAKIRVVYIKAIDFDTTFVKSTDLNDYITEGLQWVLIDQVVNARLQEEERV